VRKGYVQYVIEHRNRTAVDEDTLHNFFGFDAGNLKIGLGLNYGLSDTIDIGVYRVNGTVEKFDTYQVGGKWLVLSEDEQLLDAAILGGWSFYTISGEEDDSGGYGGALTGKSIGNYAYASVGGLWHSNSTGLTKTAADEDHSTAVLGSLSFRVTPRLLVVGEFSAPVAGYEAEATAWAGGLKFATHGHTFSLVAGNLYHLSLDGVAAGSGIREEDVILGFTITRDVMLPGWLGRGLF
jgi:hypothetical protein